MGNPIQNALIFLINIAFDFYILVLILRLCLHMTGVNFYNPVCQFVVKLTQPLLTPLQKYLPTVRRVDLGLVALAIIFEMLKLALLVLLSEQLVAGPLGLFVWATGDLLDQILTLFFYAIVIQIIMSWLGPQQYTPIHEILAKLTFPLLKPAQRLIPPIAGLDISPIPVVIGIKLVEILVTYPIINMGRYLVHV